MISLLLAFAVASAVESPHAAHQDKPDKREKEAAVAAPIHGRTHVGIEVPAGGLAQIASKKTEQHLTFKEVDLNGDGFITKDEYDKVLARGQRFIRRQAPVKEPVTLLEEGENEKGDSDASLAADTALEQQGDATTTAAAGTSATTGAAGTGTTTGMGNLTKSSAYGSAALPGVLVTALAIFVYGF